MVKGSPFSGNEQIRLVKSSRPDSDCILRRYQIHLEQDRNHTARKWIHSSSRSGISTELKHPRLPIKAAYLGIDPQSALRTERVSPKKKKDYAQGTTVGQDS
ncbi:hypothetical protein CEXT_607951 [Caerostris extrusa]|uniref:Uncharacterized protein n=1 Tax=Caerostris extrusa TaxID=172846 RepID=A0AAV4Q8Q5_CAEEX|nr:hypothetical protein CEXT_607951 [Caerostris extrusa]